LFEERPGQARRALDPPERGCSAVVVLAVENTTVLVRIDER